mgnify:CR=1 FL=1
MSKLARILLIVAGLTLTNGPAVAEGFKAGMWAGERFYAKSGKFSRCLVRKIYQDGTSLGFAINNFGKVEIWLWNNKWTLEKGKKYNIQFGVDYLRRRYIKAKARTKTMLSFIVSETRTVFKELKRGQNLYFGNANKTVLKYSLKGSSLALDKAMICYASAPDRKSVV